MAAQESTGAGTAAACAAVFLLSAAIIALELALMRCLSVARWHHFSYLVVSTALLGFGASGTFLTFVGERLRRRFWQWSCGLTVAFAVSVTLALRAAEALPLDVQYVLYSVRQAGLMFAHDFLLFIPFFTGATVIGLALMHFGERVHLVYGANLAGSGAGGAAVTGLMFFMAPQYLLYAAAALGFVAAVCWAAGAPRRRIPLCGTVAGAAVLLGLVGVVFPLRLRIDPYKFLSTMRRWEAENRAEHLLTRYGPRARLDVYDSPALHQIMFAGPTATEAPPPQLAVLADGHHAATVLKVDSPRPAEILDHTPMSLPYRFMERPRVLLLGEAGGTNVWLARRMGAEHITVVQPNPQLVELMVGPLQELGGGGVIGPDVTVHVASPRAFVERTREHFDIIQVVTAEGQAAGASSLRSLHEDFLLTVQGLARCMSILSDRGVLSVTRGIQAPPRDNVKLFATLRSALPPGVDAGRRLVQVRNLLAATSLAFASPMGEQRCETLRSAAEELRLDIAWAPCEGIDYADQINRVDGPEDSPHSYFHHAALQILSEGREDFFDNWAYNVRPATDDRPYFYNFFRWRSLPRFWGTYGRLWLTRLELGYVVLVFALAQVVLTGAVLILLPLLKLRKARGASAKLPVLAYFTCLGLGFMMIEMTCLLKFTHFLGDPIYAAAGMLTSFLVFSGLGSVVSGFLFRSRRRAIAVAAAGIAVLAVAYALGLGALFAACAGLSPGLRVGLSVLVTAPAAFLMGFPFPGGLSLLERGRPPLVPWAWGANGFASVAASSLTVMIAIAAGFRAVLCLAAVLYVAAGAISQVLPGEPEGTG